ncbi:Tetratricopeptide (TPR) repeat [Amycolatopsis xylanica]|uniref:Tetratricopeptide (TPR) repeat n=1 Tax=Amycolatopsis xylanica TaxID=589385 RepID=A0A1H2SRE2_9PSEU|nr:Tetratricopeptide (TPR) repeat [Amycolatopsis xylanica]
MEVRHHTIVVVDIEGFGDRRRTNTHQRGVRDGLYQVVEKAFTTAGLPWADCYREDRGDAIFILAPATAPKPLFVESLPPNLITALRVHNETHPDAQRIRLRLALHAGEVYYDAHGVTSASLTLAFRLIDAAPLKAALAASPGVLAVITSNWFFDDVVRHSPGAAPATYRQVSVAEKETTTTGWITLPDHPYPPDAASSPTVPRNVPRQLPLAVRDFTGRAEHLAALDKLIPPEGEEMRAVVISAVDGCAGIGKTTLAVHWAHRVQHRFPDGTLHINLRGYGPGEPASPGEALDGFLRALDTPADKMPTGADAQAALYRSLLDGRRMLIVLDNANSAAQVRPLLPGTPGCMVLVTSRDSLTGLVVTEAAYRLNLDLLSPPEALQFVSGIIGTDRTEAEPEAVKGLIRLCAQLPLALRIAASKVAAHPQTTVAEVVAELAEEGLNALSRGSDELATVRTVFDWSYQRLPADQARPFRLLGLHPGPDLTPRSAAALTDLDLPTARNLLDDLAAANLVEPTGRGRYRLHDLLRAYAADRAHHDDSNESLMKAMETLLGWYTHMALACDQVLFPAHPRLSLRLPAPTDAAPSLDRARAFEWFESERRNLLAALHNAVNNQLHEHALHLAECTRFLGLSGSWDERLDSASLGLAVARSCGDLEAEMKFLSIRGEAFMDLRRWNKAQDDLDYALKLARTAHNRTQETGALNNLGAMYCDREQFEKALRYLQETLPLTRDNASERQEAVVEGNLSRAYSGLNRYREAIEHGERGLEFRRRSGDLTGESGALRLVAEAWQGLGNHEKAIMLCREAIILSRAVGQFQTSTAEALATLAISLYQTGEAAEAISCWREAAALFDEYGGPHRAADIRQRLREVEGG